MSGALFRPFLARSGLNTRASQTPTGVGVWERKEREDQGRRTQVKANQHRFSDADDSGAGPLVPAPGLASLISGSKPDGRGAHRKDLNAARTSLVKRSGSCHAAK